MPVFIDTSGLFALLDATDDNHPRARSAWSRLAVAEEDLLSSNYVLVETLALVGRRLGIQAVRDFQSDFLPILDILWVDEPLHRRAMAALLTAGTRDLSLVDCVSFEIMRRRGLTAALAFDGHFVQQGFVCLS